jgi:hypothetical protein
MQIFVTSLANKTLALTVESSDTADMVKIRIQVRPKPHSERGHLSHTVRASAVISADVSGALTRVVRETLTPDPPNLYDVSPLNGKSPTLAIPTRQPLLTS